MVRVRYAPSPTGHIHVGNARTAIFNYLYARHEGGTFIMRLDDTDLERSTEENIDSMLDDIRWLGLDWDEGFLKGGDLGPYRETERKPLYDKYLQQLLDEDKAYRCFCTRDEVEAERRQAEAEHRIYRYGGTCAHLSADQVAGNIAEGKPYVIRLRIPVEDVVVHDLIRGDVQFKSEEFDDFVIARQNGIPIYNFATVIDDALMNITHIIRAEEHLSNTPRQVFIYRALGFDVPEFAHVSLILAPDHSKLSKRHGAVSVGEYRLEGYLPEALINYLVLLGWSPKDDREFFTVDELIKEFSLAGVGKSGAVFDKKKLTWMNHMYLGRKDAADTLAILKKDFAKEYDAAFGGLPEDKTLAAIDLTKGNAQVLPDLFRLARNIVQAAVSITDEKSREVIGSTEAKQVLQYLVEHFDAIPFGQGDDTMSAWVEDLRNQIPLPAKKLYSPIRVALFGSKDGPEIVKLFLMLEPASIRERLQKALAL
ncbi:MAG TPA: glutamate--tRNA ligase [Clostridia bacterium]|nr:glutamate--tRNA ligase [Clostridia bacterium]